MAYYAATGHRIIGCASKNLTTDFTCRAREDVESNMKFLGFIIFENKLKRRTLPTLAELKAAGLKMSMVTGDNILTSISVSRSCGLLGRHDYVFTPCEVTHKAIRLSSHLSSKEPEFHVELGEDGSVLGKGSTKWDSISICCTGDDLDKIAGSVSNKLFKEFLSSCNVFARMAPIQKKRLVEFYQRVGECVCFCGDGANDCAALMSANVGISLSQADASVAAPFTSNVCDIGCVPTILKIGRASLVTSFCCFKYMSLYSIVQFSTLSFLYSFGSALSDWQFIYIDLFLILPFGVLLTYYEPSRTLARDMPDAKLISTPVLSSIVSQMLLQASFQAVVFFQTRRWEPPSKFMAGENVMNPEATALALFSPFVYIILALIYSEGQPHRLKHSCKTSFLFCLFYGRFVIYLWCLDAAHIIYPLGL